MADNRSEIAEIIVEFNADYTGRNGEAIEMVKAQGLTIDTIDDDDGIVTGTILADRIADLLKLACVSNVRVVNGYLRDSAGS